MARLFQSSLAGLLVLCLVVNADVIPKHHATDPLACNGLAWMPTVPEGDPDYPTRDHPPYSFTREDTTPGAPCRVDQIGNKTINRKIRVVPLALFGIANDGLPYIPNFGFPGREIYSGVYTGFIVQQIQGVVRIVSDVQRYCYWNQRQGGLPSTFCQDNAPGVPEWIEGALENTKYPVFDLTVQIDTSEPNIVISETVLYDSTAGYAPGWDDGRDALIRLNCTLRNNVGGGDVRQPDSTTTFLGFPSMLTPTSCNTNDDDGPVTDGTITVFQDPGKSLIYYLFRCDPSNANGCKCAPGENPRTSQCGITLDDFAAVRYERVTRDTNGLPTQVPVNQPVLFDNLSAGTYLIAAAAVPFTGCYAVGVELYTITQTPELNANETGVAESFVTNCNIDDEFSDPASITVTLTTPPLTRNSVLVPSYTTSWEICASTDPDDCSFYSDDESITVPAGLYRIRYETPTDCIHFTSIFEVTESAPLSFNEAPVSSSPASCASATDGSITGLLLLRGTVDVTSSSNITWYRCGSVGATVDEDACRSTPQISVGANLTNIRSGQYLAVGTLGDCSTFSSLFTVTDPGDIIVDLCITGSGATCSIIDPTDVSCNAGNTLSGVVPTDGSIAGVQVLNVVPGYTYRYTWNLGCNPSSPCPQTEVSTDTFVPTSSTFDLPTLTNLGPGYYTIDVTLVGRAGSVCSGAGDVALQVLEPGLISSNSTNGSVQSTNPRCSGSSDGSIVVSSGFFSDETVTFRYQWYRCTSTISNIASIPSGVCGPVYATTRNLSNVPAGVYYLFAITPDNCIVIPPASTASLANPAPLSIDPGAITPIRPTCEGTATGGFLSLSSLVSGGTPPYTYSWYLCTSTCAATPSQLRSTARDPNDLVSGLYLLVVADNNGCSASTANLGSNGPTVPSVAALTATNNLVAGDISCANGNGPSADGTITGSVPVSGGTPPYSFTWSGPNGFSRSSTSFQNLNSLVAGLYTLTITDSNSCSPITYTVTLNQPTALSVQVSNITVTEPTCNPANGGTEDGTISVTASVSGGTPPFTFSWTDGIVASPPSSSPSYNGQPGRFFLKVFDANGCSASTSDAVIVPDAPEITVVSAPVVTPPQCNAANPNPTDPRSTYGSVDGTSAVLANAELPVEIEWYYCANISVPQPSVTQCLAIANGAAPLASILGVLRAAPGHYLAIFTDNNGCVVGSVATIPTTTAVDINIGGVEAANCDIADSTGSIENITLSGPSGSYRLIAIPCGELIPVPPPIEDCPAGTPQESMVTIPAGSSVSSVFNFRGLPPGFYYLRVISSTGCVAVPPAIQDPVTIAGAIRVTAISTNVTCQGPNGAENGGSIVANVVGGVAGTNNTVVIRNQFVNNPNFPNDPTVWGVRNALAVGPTNVTFSPLYRGAWSVEATSSDGCQDATNVTVGGFACIDPGNSTIAKCGTRRGLTLQYGEALLTIQCDHTYDGNVGGHRPLTETELTLLDLDIYIYGPVDRYCNKTLLVNGLKYDSNGIPIPYHIAYPEAGIELVYMGNWLDEGYKPGQWIISFIPPEAGYYNVTVYPVGPSCNNPGQVNIPIGGESVLVAVGEGYSIQAWGLCEGLDCCHAVSDCLVDLEANVDNENPYLRAPWRRAPCLCPFPVCACGYTYDSVCGLCVKYRDPLSPVLRHTPYHNLEECLCDYARASDRYCTQPLESAWFKCKKAAGFC